MATIGTVPRRPHIALQLRLPPELHARLVALAEQEHRSLTAQVIHVMGQWADQQEREQRERREREERGGAGEC